MESGILGFRIRYKAQYIRDPANDRLESEIRDPNSTDRDSESMTWNPESNTVLDSLTSGET